MKSIWAFVVDLFWAFLGRACLAGFTYLVYYLLCVVILRPHLEHLQLGFLILLAMVLYPEKAEWRTKTGIPLPIDKRRKLVAKFCADCMLFSLFLLWLLGWHVRSYILTAILVTAVTYRWGIPLLREKWLVREPSVAEAVTSAVLWLLYAGLAFTGIWIVLRAIRLDSPAWLAACLAYVVGYLDMVDWISSPIHSGRWLIRRTALAAGLVGWFASSFILGYLAEPHPSLFSVVAAAVYPVLCLVPWMLICRIAARLTGARSRRADNLRRRLRYAEYRVAVEEFTATLCARIQHRMAIGKLMAVLDARAKSVADEDEDL